VKNVKPLLFIPLESFAINVEQNLKEASISQMIEMLIAFIFKMLSIIKI